MTASIQHRSLLQPRQAPRSGKSGAAGGPRPTARLQIDCAKLIPPPSARADLLPGIPTKSHKDHLTQTSELVERERERGGWGGEERASKREREKEREKERGGTKEREIARASKRASERDRERETERERK
jgi:hypothetical protein